MTSQDYVLQFNIHWQIVNTSRDLVQQWLTSHCWQQAEAPPGSWECYDCCARLPRGCYSEWSVWVCFWTDRHITSPTRILLRNEFLGAGHEWETRAKRVRECELHESRQHEYNVASVIVGRSAHCLHATNRSVGGGPLLWLSNSVSVNRETVDNVFNIGGCILC